MSNTPWTQSDELQFFRFLLPYLILTVLPLILYYIFLRAVISADQHSLTDGLMLSVLSSFITVALPISYQNFQAEKVARQEAQAFILGLYKNLRDNLRLSRQIHCYLFGPASEDKFDCKEFLGDRQWSGRIIPSFNLDTHFLDSTIPLQINVLGSFNTAITDVRTGLTQINANIETLTSYATYAILPPEVIEYNITGGVPQNIYTEAFLADMKRKIPGLIGQLSNAVNHIEARFPDVIAKKP